MLIDINLGMGNGCVIPERKPGAFCFRMCSFKIEEPGQLGGCVLLAILRSIKNEPSELDAGT